MTGPLSPRLPRPLICWNTVSKWGSFYTKHASISVRESVKVTRKRRDPKWEVAECLVRSLKTHFCLPQCSLAQRKAESNFINWFSWLIAANSAHTSCKVLSEYSRRQFCKLLADWQRQGNGCVELLMHPIIRRKDFGRIGERMKQSQKWSLLEQSEGERQHKDGRYCIEMGHRSSL